MISAFVRCRLTLFRWMARHISDYGFQAESTGLPETSVVGVAVARGSAATISFLFPYMLLTVCRNLITLCRETFINRYVPFDAAIDFHRFMAMTAVVFSGGHTRGVKEVTRGSTSSPMSFLVTVVHTLAHVVNIYIFSMSDLSILSCLFPKVFSNNGYFTIPLIFLPSFYNHLADHVFFVGLNFL